MTGHSAGVVKSYIAADEGLLGLFTLEVSSANAKLKLEKVTATVTKVFALHM